MTRAERVKYTELTSLHKNKYGDWAGMPEGFRPDPSRCCVEVWRDMRSHQCTKPRGHGPEAAYCRQHDPAAVAERERKKDARFQKQRAEWMLGHKGNELTRALRLIADGHNDPRSLARATLEGVPEEFGGYQKREW